MALVVHFKRAYSGKLLVHAHLLVVDSLLDLIGDRVREVNHPDVDCTVWDLGLIQEHKKAEWNELISQTFKDREVPGFIVETVRVASLAIFAHLDDYYGLWSSRSRLQVI